MLQCGHTCPSFCGEVCPKKCPLCTSASELADSVLVCPQCDAVLDIKDLDRFVSDIYSIDENGKIIAFTSKSQSSRDIKNFSCGCRAPLHIIRRYSILKKINQAPAVFERLLVKIGRALNGFSRRIHSTEKDLDESFFNFRTQIRPNPLAAGQNKALISSRAQDLLRLSDCIHDYNISTVIPFEKSISWLQSTIPSALAPLTNHTIQSTFSLRLSILHRRARNLWISDCLRVSKYLVSLSDPSLELQRMSSLLRVRASKECWKGISDCEDALRRKEIKNAPGIEVEIRLQQIQLSHMLDIALSAGDSGESADVEVEDDNEAMAMPSMSPDAPSDSLKHAVQLCRRYPDTAGKFAGLVNGFAKYKDEMMKMDGRKKMRGANANGNANTDLNVYALATLPRTCNTETRKLEWSWGEYVGGGLKVCSKAGHLYSRNWTTTVKIDKDASGCLECGGREMRGVKLVGGMDGEVSDQGQAEKEAVRKAGSCLFEDRFLDAMRGKGK